MQEILSVNNETIKQYAKLKQKKYRLEQNLFIIEGAKCVEAAISKKLEIADIFVLKDKAHKFNYENITLTDEKVMKKMADTETVPEILAIAKIKTLKFNAEKYKKIAVFENIKDAGNLGTIIRSACAFNIDAIILTGDCIDIYNPKVIRSSVGNIFNIPIFKIETKNLAEILKGFSVYSTIVKNGQDLEDVKFAPKSAILFGSEADGITKELKNCATTHITLKMENNVESLNLAISASVIFYKMMLSIK